MDASKPVPDENDYRAYVGPPELYDFIGAMQFRLLCALGLRANHCLLDFGCGSLRAGRLFMMYLDRGRYYGIEPNRWLIEAAIANQVGNDLVRLKNPRFDYNSNFDAGVFSTKFDFILAHAIFSHTGGNLIRTALQQFSKTLQPGGLIATTFLEGERDFEGRDWVYPGSTAPGCAYYRRKTIECFAGESGLFSARIPWYHPRQTWYLLAKEKDQLPDRALQRHLSGAVLSATEFLESRKPKGWAQALRAKIFG